MVIEEILLYPTVKQVIFQITFPNLFYLENRIGNIQEKIMGEFPKSNLVYRRNLFSVNFGMDKNSNEEVLQKELGNSPLDKIWQFESKNKTKLNITTSTLDMSSISHKTYQLGEDDNKKFRYEIERVVGTFIDVVNLPIINRIGLRYIDHCPLRKKNYKTLREWYNSKFPADFEIAEAESMAFQTKVKRGKYYLGYAEAIAQINGKDTLILDLDGSAENINASEYLEVSDDLHTLISEEYAKTIKGNTGPLYQFMKTGSEE